MSTFCLFGILSVDILSVRHFVCSTLCPSTFCLSTFCPTTVWVRLGQIRLGSVFIFYCELSHGEKSNYFILNVRVSESCARVCLLSLNIFWWKKRLSFFWWRKLLEKCNFYFFNATTHFERYYCDEERYVSILVMRELCTSTYLFVSIYF